jgi:beta-glucanase (GH16 family)
MYTHTCAACSLDTCDTPVPYLGPCHLHPHLPLLPQPVVLLTQPSGTSTYGGWPWSGEIDIMEAVNSEGIIYSTLHYQDAWPAGGTHTGGKVKPSNPGSEFHIYGCEWTPYYIRFYVDGITTITLTDDVWSNFYFASSDNLAAPFDKPFAILLNLAVGGKGCWEHLL